MMRVAATAVGVKLCQSAVVEKENTKKIKERKENCVRREALQTVLGQLLVKKYLD